MSLDGRADDASSLDEGSWIYLCATATDVGAKTHLHQRVVEACEESGWPAVSWSPKAPPGDIDPGRFFRGVRHAVEHADVVVAFIDERGGVADAELALAYSHRRPIVGLSLSGQPPSGIQSMLGSYERARVVNCANADECFTELRRIFADPDFSETVRRAAGENIRNA